MTGPQNRDAPRRTGFTLVGPAFQPDVRRKSPAGTPDLRGGFTLVELLVALALIVFILAILAEAFEKGIGTFRRLKAISDMNERLRSASSIIRRYLAAEHFEGSRRLSDGNFEWSPPQEGFFRIWQGSPDVLGRGGVEEGEGADEDGIHSYRSVDHILHFSVKLRGTSPAEFFRTSLLPPDSKILTLIPNGDVRFQEPGAYHAVWAEVAFFLKDSGETTSDPLDPSRDRLKLYTLHLRQRLAVPDSDLFGVDFPANQVPASDYTTSRTGDYAEMSFYRDANHLYFNSPQDLTMPGRRMGATGPAGATSQEDYLRLVDEPPGRGSPGLGGTDVLLTDVLSMDVRVMNANGVYNSLYACGYPRPPYTATHRPRNPDFGTAAVFDTWSSRADRFFDYRSRITPYQRYSIPLTDIQVYAIQVTLRVWDRRTQQTRQTSILQDL
jgi:prepilin-type N-terminal cleavage/methylation domain-containing protein